MQSWHMTVAFREETLAAAHAAYPNTFPKGTPMDWDIAQLRRALDVLASMDDDAEIRGCRVYGS